jgi:hypothetical protein
MRITFNDVCILHNVIFNFLLVFAPCIRMKMITLIMHVLNIHVDALGFPLFSSQTDIISFIMSVPGYF